MTRFFTMGDLTNMTRLGFLGVFFRLARFLHMDESKDGTRFIMVGDLMKLTRLSSLGDFEPLTRLRRLNVLRHLTRFRKLDDFGYLTRWCFWGVSTFVTRLAPNECLFFH